MKQLFTLLFLFMLSGTTLLAQDFRIVGSIGANVSSGSYSGLNYVIDRYNQTRQGQTGAFKLDRNMANINTLTGFAWRLGFVYDLGNLGIYMGVNRAGRSGSTYASGTDVNGNTTRRDVRFTANSTNLEFGMGPVRNRWSAIFGFSPDFARYRVYTSTTGTKDYTRIQNELGLGFSLFADISIWATDQVGLGIRPYYQASLLDIDFTDMSRSINPATYNNDNEESRSGSVSNIGVQVTLNIRTGQ